MSVFTAEDLAEMAAGGNAAHNAVYLGRHQRDHTLPNGSDIIKLKEFIRLKYVDKKWHTGGDGGGGGELRRPSVSGWGTGSNGASAAPAPAANVPSAFVRVRHECRVSRRNTHQADEPLLSLVSFVCRSNPRGPRLPLWRTPVNSIS